MDNLGKMPQKLRLLYIMKILLEETDDEHSLSHVEIEERLKQFGFREADRGTFADDIDQLIRFSGNGENVKSKGKTNTTDFEIIAEKEGREYRYHVGTRTFETAEIKTIIDSVQSSRFISETKSKELIEKLKTLLSRHDAESINRQVYVAERIKSDNRTNFINVDIINKAIYRKQQISFLYYDNTVKRVKENGKVIIKKEKVYRHKGKIYKVNPWNLISHNQNYYLVGCEEDGIIKHYRVDRMAEVKTVEEKVNGSHFKNLKISDYADKRFNMFDGREEKVELQIKDDMYSVIADRFGKNADFSIKDEEHLMVTVDVCVSNQFLAWILSLGDGVRITGPENVVEEMRKLIGDGSKTYG